MGSCQRGTRSGSSLACGGLAAAAPAGSNAGDGDGILRRRFTVQGVLPAPAIIAATVCCRPPFAGTHPTAAVAGARMQAHAGSFGQGQAASGEAWATGWPLFVR